MRGTFPGSFGLPLMFPMHCKQRSLIASICGPGWPRSYFFPTQ